MTKPSISKKSRYRQGTYTPKNPDKYIGDGEIRYRSSWELRLCKWLDNHQSVVCWNSEGMVVPYLSPVDNKQHKYYVDFLAKMKLKDGTIKTYAIEIKPKKEMIPPRKNKNKERMITEVTTFVTNQAKWAHAKEYCDKLGISFLVLNEHDLGIA
jgi:hypothetical protein